MNVIQLVGGPGAGKSSIAAYLYYRFKKAGYRTELVGEAAREIIYNANPGSTARQLMDNQVLVTGMQYERLQRLKRHGVRIAINDSPILQGLLYVNAVERMLMQPLFEAMAKQFDTTNIFIRRTPGVWDKESRAQSEAEAMMQDKHASSLLPSHYTMAWGEEEALADHLLKDPQWCGEVR